MNPSSFGEKMPLIRKTRKRIWLPYLAFACIGLPLSSSMQAAEPKSLKLLKEIVDVPSGTDQIKGLEKVRKILTKAFATIGYAAETLSAAEGRKVITFAVPGSEPDIILLGHIDTVFTDNNPAPSYRQQGDKVFGGGVIDMKGGIVMMYDLLRDLPPASPLRRRIQVVLNDEEEIGSPRTLPLMRNLAQGKKAILVFEPGLPDGSVVSSQSGLRWLKLTVQGKAAHAGLEHQLGYNACVELSRKVTEMAKLTDYNRRLTVNAGVLEGGTKPNVVCENASVAIDIRFADQKDLDGTLKRIKKIADKVYTTNKHISFAPSTTLEEIAASPHLPATATASLMAAIQKAAGGAAIKGVHVGYASDANLLADSGADILVGLGPYGGGMHTGEEFMSLTGYRKRLQLNRKLLSLLGQQK